MGRSEHGEGEGDFEYVGALHVHTNYSDGRADMAKVVAAARSAGVDFVWVSDHDSLAAKREGWEGWRGGVLVMAGVEISPPEGGHCLAWGVEECEGYRELPAREYLDRVAGQDGLMFIAHPEGKNRPFRLKRIEVWSEWGHPALAGMEIWSFVHDWSEGLWPLGMHTAPLRLLQPARQIRGPAPETLRRWDEIGARQRFVGIGSLDAHELGLWATWPPMSHERIFRTIRTHIRSRRLTGDARRDLAAVREALARGRCHMANDLLGDSTGFAFQAEAQGGGRIEMGEEAEYAAGVELRVKCPPGGEIVALRDGVPAGGARGRQMSLQPTGPGVYRVEVRRGGRPWIFSNPIYLRDAQR